MEAKAVSKKGCPCCNFLLDDLFLPLPVPETEGETSNQTSLELPMDPAAAAEFIVDHSKGTPTTILDSHGHAQLDRDQDDNYTISTKEQDHDGPIHLKSIACAVHPTDWDATLEYASRSNSVLPALGVHPWYLEDLQSDWLEELERLLLLHPSALVGEIGLCKMARFVRQHPEGKTVALSIQREVFRVRYVGIVVLLYVACKTNAMVLLSVLSLETNDTCGEARKTSFCALRQPTRSIPERNQRADGEHRDRKKSGLCFSSCNRYALVYRYSSSRQGATES
eukprot:scaffold6331_cov195-Cylindrotheca_fusiformis.AAC.1